MTLLWKDRGRVHVEFCVCDVLLNVFYYDIFLAMKLVKYLVMLCILKSIKKNPQINILKRLSSLSGFNLGFNLQLKIKLKIRSFAL